MKYAARFDQAKPDLLDFGFKDAALTVKTPSRIRKTLEIIAASFIVLFLFYVVFGIIYTYYALQDGGRNDCKFQLQKIGYGLLRYHEENKSLPPPFITKEADSPRVSWRVAIIPPIGRYYDRSKIASYRWNEEWNSPTNSQYAPPITGGKNLYHCPSDTGDADDTSYLAVVGKMTAFREGAGFRLSDIPNTFVTRTKEMLTYTEYGGGASNTLLVVESHNTGIHWREPRDLAFEDAVKPVNSKDQPSIGSLHPPVRLYGKGGFVLAADGGVRWLNDDTDPKILRSLLEVDSPDKPKEVFGQ